MTDELGEKILAALDAIHDTLVKFYKAWKDQNPTGAVALTMKVSGGNGMATFTVDTTDGVATVQFDDDHGDATAGPNDSVTGSPIVPVVTSDTTTVLTVATGVAGTDPGEFTYALTPVIEGTANLSVSPITNSDGSPALDSAGVAFTLPAPVAVTVTAGAAADLTLSVSG